MPNWADDEGRYYWGPPGVPFYDQVEIPHAPVTYKSDCLCDCCAFARKQRGAPEPQSDAERIKELEDEVERLKSLRRTKHD